MEALARSGHRVAFCARRAERVETAERDLKRQGFDVSGLTADVSRAADVERLFTEVDGRFGRLDVLVTNAGGPPPGGLLSATDLQWQSAFELTLMSAVRAIRLAIPRMRANRFGRIVAIGSSSVKQPLDNLVLSNAMRPAIVGVIKSVASEVIAEGITLNVVSPGRADTARVRELEREAQDAGQIVRGIPCWGELADPKRRYAAPAEVAALVAFLASEDAGYITAEHPRRRRHGGGRFPDARAQLHDGSSGCTRPPHSFRDQRDVDHEAAAENADYLIHKGMNGIVVAGTYGEYVTLTGEERRALLRTVIKAAAGRVPIIATTAAGSTAEVIAHTRDAEEAGADGAMITPPYGMIEPTESAIVSHFEAIAQATTSALLLYNNPNISPSLAPELLARLADIDGYVGIKQGATRSAGTNELLRSAGDRLRIFAVGSGDGRLARARRASA